FLVFLCNFSAWVGSISVMTQIADIDARVEKSWIAQRLRISYHLVAALFGSIDWLLTTIASVVASCLFQIFWPMSTVSLDMSLGAGIAGGFIYVFLANSAGMYRMPALLNPYRHLSKVIFSIAIMFLLLT